ncbi:MAG: hypothetical protein GKR93_12130 [Gammaproteobacteria bacterium]|nr:hypothetical protein [Gammaproteobacteria bacterium]
MHVSGKPVLTKQTVLAELHWHHGKRYGITAEQLVKAILHETRPSDLRRLRQIIESLRQEGQHICGHPRDGYYIAESVEELEETCTYLFKRSITSIKQIAAMKKLSLPDLAGQLRINV